jgi:hypothetical protein
MVKISWHCFSVQVQRSIVKHKNLFPFTGQKQCNFETTILFVYFDVYFSFLFCLIHLISLFAFDSEIIASKGLPKSSFATQHFDYFDIFLSFFSIHYLNSLLTVCSEIIIILNNCRTRDCYMASTIKFVGAAYIKVKFFGP